MTKEEAFKLLAPLVVYCRKMPACYACPLNGCVCEDSSINLFDLGEQDKEDLFKNTSDAIIITDVSNRIRSLTDAITGVQKEVEVLERALEKACDKSHGLATMYKEDARRELEDLDNE